MRQSGKALTAVLGIGVGGVVIALLGLLSREFYVYVSADKPEASSPSSSVKNEPDRRTPSKPTPKKRESPPKGSGSLDAARRSGAVASGEIRGEVRDEQGQPLEGAEVVVVQFGETQKILGRVETGASGSFALREIPSRYCQVTASYPGLVSQTETRVTPGERELPFRLETGGQVFGRVIAEMTEDPIPGAIVRGRAYMDRRRQWVGEVETDSAGEFRFDAVPARTLRFEIDADGFQPRLVPSVLMKRGIELEREFRLKPGLSLVGRVVDGESGDGVDGAVVTFGRRLLNEQRMTTDDRGEFSITEVTHGIQLFEVQAEGFGDLKKSVNIKTAQMSGPITFELYKARTLKGKVVGEEKAPVASAKIFLGVDSPYIPQRAEPAALSDADGGFELPDLTAGHSYFLLVRHREYPDVLTKGLSVLDFAEETLEIELSPGATIQGRVENPDGEPIANARIVVTDVVDLQEPDERIPTSPKRLERDRGKSEDDGSFLVRNLIPGPKRLVVSAAPDYLSRTVEVDELSAGETSEEIIVVLSAGEVIAGSVVGVDSVAVGDVRIQATSNDTANPSFGSATSAEDGTFRIPQLSGASFKISARKPGYSVEIVDDVAAGSEDVLIVLKKNGTVSGTVRSRTTNDPVPRFLVRMTRTTENAPPFSRSRQFTSDEGAFFFPDIMPGEYRVEVTAKDFAPGTVPAVVVNAGAETKGVLVTLPEGGVIQGRVADTQGQPVPRATIFAKSTDSRPGAATNPATRRSPQSKSVLLQDDGTYKIGGLGDGTYEVYASAPRYSISDTQLLQVAEGVQTEQNFVLSKGAILTVYAVRDGAPVPRAKVGVRDGNGSPVFPVRIRKILERYEEGTEARTRFEDRLHRTDNRGFVKILNLPVGSYEVVVTSNDGAEGSQSIRLGEGEDLEITVEIP